MTAHLLAAGKPWSRRRISAPAGLAAIRCCRSPRHGRRLTLARAARHAVPARHPMARGKGQAGRTARCCGADGPDGRFVIPLMPNGVPAWLTRSETRLAEKALEMGPTSVAEIAATQLALGAIDRLISRGLLTLAAFTPTDALHVTGDFDAFDAEAARLGAELMARQRNGVGAPITTDTFDLAAPRWLNCIAGLALR